MEAKSPLYLALVAAVDRHAKAQADWWAAPRGLWKWLLGIRAEWYRALVLRAGKRWDESL